MDTHRARGNSPPRHRQRYNDPRASTGSMLSSSSFEPSYNPTHRGSLDPSRLSHFGYEAHPLTKKTYVDSGIGGGTTSRTEYAVRPRKDSSTTSENRRPVSVFLSPTSPTRNHPVISNLNPDPRDRFDRPRSPPSRSNRPHDDTAGHLYVGVPASTRNHQRHHSATPAQMDRLHVGRRDGRERAGYHRTGENRQSTYPVSRPPIRIAEEEAYSYTGPREQFDRDFPSKPPPRRDSHTRAERLERPLSVMGPPEWKPPPRREAREIAAPSSASRQLDRVDRSDPSRLSIRTGHESDSDRGLDAPRRRQSVRTPVLHQSHDNEYATPKDDFERRVAKQARDRYEDDPRHVKDRDYDKPDRQADPRRILRSRESSPERSGQGKGLAAVGLGGLAAVGIAGVRKDGRSKDDQSDSEERKERRRRKHRTRDAEEPESAGAERVLHDKYDDDYDDRNRPTERRERVRDDRNGDDAAVDGQKRRRHRRRHRQKDETGKDIASESGSDRPISYPPSEKNPPRENGRLNQRAVEESDLGDSDTNLSYHPRDLALMASPERRLSPGEDEDSRPRRVTLIEPLRDDDRPKPKGILKPARAVPFPEDPNPAREGVAPLKEAGKEGVPPRARWTKINRLLVNPEALGKAHERFEERDDYVIVLRVLKKEEINKLAEKTQEIREAREREWHENQTRLRTQSRGEYSSDQEESRRPPLTIEAPPQNPGAEQWHGQRQAHDPAERSLSATEAVPTMADLNLAAENYSTNKSCKVRKVWPVKTEMPDLERGGGSTNASNAVLCCAFFPKDGSIQRYGSASVTQKDLDAWPYLEQRGFLHLPDLDQDDRTVVSTPPWSIFAQAATCRRVGRRNANHQHIGFSDRKTDEYL